MGGACGPPSFFGEYMPKFNVKFSQVYEVVIEADTLGTAQGQAHKVVAQFPPGHCKLLSILAEGVADPTAPESPTPPFGRPVGGGSPGTPTVRVPELVDQIAKQEAA